MKVKDVKKWFEIAKPNPTTEDACVQIGCHYEEVGEMAMALFDDGISLCCDELADEYKLKGYNNNLTYLLDSEERIELLDSLCDQIVTAIGVAHMLGMDIDGALNEVNKSNHSKFENGKAVLDENGKIRKGKDYFKPDLTKFI